MIGRTITGLDLGSWSVKAVELRAGLRALEVLRADELQLPAYASVEETEATVQLFLEQRGFSREYVVTAIPAERLTQRHLRFPFSGARRIEQAISFEIEEELPLALDQVIIAHEQVPASPEQTDVLAVVAPRAEIELHLQAAHRLDLEPRVVEVEGSVLANLSSWLELASVGRLLIDIGHRKTTICLLVDGKPALLRSVPLAGHHLTEALARENKIAYDAAEELKHEGGLFKGGGTIPACPAVGAVLESIVKEAMRSVQAAVGDPLDPIAPAEITLCGGSARAPGIVFFFEQRTGLPTRVLKLPPDTEGASALETESLASLAHATALALRGSTTERVTSLDLRQQEFQYIPDLTGLRGQLQLALGLFSLVLMLWLASLASQVWSARSHGDAMRTQLQELFAASFPGEPRPADPARAFESRLRETRELANHLGVTGSGTSVLEVLRLVSERIPASLDVGLSELRLERHSLRAKGYSPDFVSVDKVRAQLQQVALFQEVVLSDVVNNPRGGGKNFSLTIRFRGVEE